MRSAATCPASSARSSLRSSSTTPTRSIWSSAQTPHVEGIYTGEEIKEIRKNAIHAGLKLVDCPIRHLGTEKAQQLYLAIQNYLADNGVEMLFLHRV